MNDIWEASVDYLSYDAGTYESWFLPDIMKTTSKPGYQVDITYDIKKKVKIPVFANGRINTSYLAEEIIITGNADAVVLQDHSLLILNLSRKLWRIELIRL